MGRGTPASTRWVFSLVLAGSASAFGGPPFFTNDPDPPEPGQWEINLPWFMERSRDGSAIGEFVRVDVNYGYDPYTQLSIELPAPYRLPAEGGLRSGVGDVLFEYKRRFGLDAEAGYFGINPQLTLPTGDEKRGLGAGRATLQLPLLYQKQWGDTVIYGDARYKLWAGAEGKSYWFFGLALEHAVGKRLKLGGEVFAITSPSPGGEPNAGFNLGGKWVMAPGRVLMVSAGRSFRDEPELTLLIGLNLLFSPNP
ncbi:transporter [Methylocaldum sp. 14B]|uniref:transporter n=1 Tax=Methylocaldum sp. 14B TaxID=1912213 RepID=UPI00098ACF30|nr:transporter [Methylocaldum sp. 14B]